MTYDRLRSVVEFPPSRLSRCQTLSNRFSPDCGRFSRKLLPVAHTWENPGVVDASLVRDLGKFVSSGDADVVANHPSPNIQRPPEDPRKSEGIVDLVGKIRPACRNYSCTRLLRLPGPNLRNGIRTSEDNRVIRHRGHYFLGNHTRSRCRHRNQNIRPLHRLLQAACPSFRVCLQSNLPFRMVLLLQLYALAIENSLAVDHDDVSRYNSRFHHYSRDR